MGAGVFNRSWEAQWPGFLSVPGKLTGKRNLHLGYNLEIRGRLIMLVEVVLRDCHTAHLPSSIVRHELRHTRA